MLACRVDYAATTKEIFPQYMLKALDPIMLQMWLSCSAPVALQLGTSSCRGEEGALQHPHFPIPFPFTYVGYMECSHLGELAAASVSDQIAMV